MKKWEKRYVGNAARWGLFALSGTMLGATALIFVLVPYGEILKYKDGKFFYYYPRAEYNWISALIFFGGAGICLFSVVWEIVTNQRVLDKILRSLLTLFLELTVLVTIGVNGLMSYGLFSGWNLPTAWEEYTISGDTLVLACAPHGMHHQYPALYELRGDDVQCIGSGEDIEGGAEDFRVTAAENGYTVTYIETINGERVMKSFTAERKD